MTFEVPVHSSGFSWGEVEFLDEEHPKTDTFCQSSHPPDLERTRSGREHAFFGPKCVTIPGIVQKHHLVAK